MCVAGGIEQNRGNHPVLKAWYNFSHCPFRLFTLAALTHSVILFSVVMLDVLPALPQTEHNLLFISLFGLLASPVLGALLHWLPQRFNQSAISYGWYSFSYLLIFVGLAMLEIGLFSGPLWTAMGSFSMSIAWLMAIHAFNNIGIWVDAKDKRWFRLLLIGLYSVLTGITLFWVGNFSQSLVLTHVIPVALFTFGSLSVVVSTVLLGFKKRAPKLIRSSCCVAENLNP